MERWQFMWGLAFVIFCGCKWFTWNRVSRTLGRRELAYLLLWPGLDAQDFPATNPRRPSRRRANGLSPGSSSPSACSFSTGSSGSSPAILTGSAGWG